MEKIAPIDKIFPREWGRVCQGKKLVQKGVIPCIEGTGKLRARTKRGTGGVVQKKKENWVSFEENMKKAPAAALKEGLEEPHTGGDSQKTGVGTNRHFGWGGELVT